MNTRIALLWVGDLQYEFMQPIDGAVDIYPEELADGSAIRFHHACMRVDNRDGFRRQVAEMSLPVAIEGSSNPLQFLYLNARAHLGYCLKYPYMSAEFWATVGGQ